MAKLPSSINLTVENAYAHYALKGKDAKALATAYFQAWAAKVPSGTTMLLAKVKCVLAEGDCGCPEDSSIFKCTGPYPPVPVEILKDVLEQGVEGIQMAFQPAPEALIVDKHVYFVEGVGPHSLLVGGPAQAMYITKL